MKTEMEETRESRAGVQHAGKMRGLDNMGFVELEAKILKRNKRSTSPQTGAFVSNPKLALSK